MVAYKSVVRGIPNLCTLLNGACGIIALMTAVFYESHSAIHLACLFIALGALFDTMDGRLARHLKVTSEIGKQLDSFSDLVTFGVAPICVFFSMHATGRHLKVTVVQIIISAIYISCAMYRLARYNVSAPSDCFQGLPTTSAGLILSVYTLTSNYFVHRWEYSHFYSMVSYGLILLVALAMISNVKVKRI